MSTEPELAPVLRAWLQDRTSTPSQAGLARVLDLVAVTPPQQPRGMRALLPRPAAHPTTAPTGRSRTMFSATRLVAALAIVALGTGTLFFAASPGPASVVSPSPSSMTWTPPAGLITEEVEPGVLRVVDDGAGHDLVTEPPLGLEFSPDGRLWLLEGGTEGIRSMVELGRADSEVDFGSPRERYWFDMAFGPDGTAWAKLGGNQHGATLASYDGAGWTERPWPDGSEVGAIEATRDGAVLVAGTVDDGPGPRVTRIDEGGRTDLPTPDDPALRGSYHGLVGYLAAAPDGTVWLSNGWFHLWPGAPSSLQGLLRFDGERWQLVDPMPDVPSRRAGPLAIGPDGTLWVYLETDGPASRRLARWRDDEWTVFSQDDGVPRLVLPQVWDAQFAVDGAGTLWIPYTMWDQTELREPWTDRCPGVISFDGSASRQYLEGHCGAENRLAVAPDGSVWVTSEGVASDVVTSVEHTDRGLYVITPEAAAAVQ